ncbi:MAG TPA: response regulator [bacterium]|nr:response regulator [bacterium]
MKKILIVEDNYGEVAVEALKEFDFEIHLTTNVKEGLEKIEVNHYLAVICDMQMPLNAGEEVNPKAGEIIFKLCAKKLIPVFIITSGIYSHGETFGIVDLLFDPTVYVNSESELNFVLHHRIRGVKNYTTYKEMWVEINNKFSDLIKSRSRYLEHVLRE